MPAISNRILAFCTAGVILVLLVHYERNFIDLAIGIAWPLSLVLLALLFKDEIVHLAARLKKLGKDGAEFEQPQVPIQDEKGLPGSGLDQQNPRIPGPAPTSLSLEDTIAPAFRPLFKQRFAALKDRLPAVKATFPHVTELDLAMAWSAELSAAVHLERASRYIFRSQLSALDALKLMPAKKEMFRPFYDQAVRDNPTLYTNYTFESWYNFLVAMELVSGTDDNVTVTSAGEAIGIYMAQQKYLALQL